MQVAVLPREIPLGFAQVSCDIATPTGLIAQDVLFGDFGEAAVLPCFGAEACKELFGPVGPASTTEPFLGEAFVYPPLGMGPL